MEVRFARPNELALCLDVRRAVFIDEQNVAFDEEVDGQDPTCIHAVAISEGRVVGTARMRILKSGDARVQRVAVLANHRGRGLGKRIMDLMEDEARRAECSRVVLDAQVAIIPFYERRGYQPEGEPFLDAGIAHRFMWKRLRSGSGP
ncbi:MAG: GNAT family N-acetyltransferase [Gemmatimonadetes bacterium]|nr:GNAT family N-acetyltransferase [Gemmatimonadota bacterium]